MWHYELDIYTTASGGCEERYSIRDANNDEYCTTEAEAYAERIVSLLNLGSDAEMSFVLDYDRDIGNRAAEVYEATGDPAAFDTMCAALPF